MLIVIALLIDAAAAHCEFTLALVAIRNMRALVGRIAAPRVRHVVLVLEDAELLLVRFISLHDSSLNALDASRRPSSRGHGCGDCPPRRRRRTPCCACAAGRRRAACSPRAAPWRFRAMRQDRPDGTCSEISMMWT